MKSINSKSSALTRILLPAVFAMVIAICSEVGAESTDESETKVSFRYRYEFVDQSGFDDNARASTWRGRLSHKTPHYNGFSFFGEADAVVALGSDDYNSGQGTSSAARTRYPVVADPDYIELNQIFVQFDGFDNTNLRLGRQRINFDNQRFVGGVGWRQNEQTYDAFRVTNKSFFNTTINYAFIDNVNRIFGDDVAAGDHESATHLLNVGRKFENVGTLSVYYYGIDNDDAAAFSTDTFGARFSGKTTTLSRNFGYNVELATQSDAANNPVDYDAGYFRVDGNMKFGGVTALAGFEVLEGDSNQSGSSFRTPLATLHAFNGWADQFLGTPAAGLEDFFIGAKGKAGRYAWQAIWHDFSAEDGSGDFGQEFDVSVSTKFAKHYSALLKAATFNADQAGFRDTTKIWLMLSANY